MPYLSVLIKTLSLDVFEFCNLQVHDFVQGACFLSWRMKSAELSRSANRKAGSWTKRGAEFEMAGYEPTAIVIRDEVFYTIRRVESTSRSCMFDQI